MTLIFDKICAQEAIEIPLYEVWNKIKCYHYYHHHYHHHHHHYSLHIKNRGLQFLLTCLSFIANFGTFVFPAKGRTNVELREKFILPEGATQVMASFRYRGRRSRPSSRGASPNRSTSSQSCPVPTNPAATSPPKVRKDIC